MENTMFGVGRGRKHTAITLSIPSQTNVAGPMSKSTTSTMISTSDVLITPEEASHSARIGGKARALADLHAADLPVPDWLDRRPVLYMLSHMVIMPAIALLAAGCDWAAAAATPPAGLAWFLGASFFGGLVFEIGRKIRAPDGERTGVETYSKVWGRTRAVVAWLGVLLLAGGAAVGAAEQVGVTMIAAGILGAALLGAVVVAGRFLRAPSPDRAEAIEVTSGAWLLVLYGSVGLLPLVW